MPKNSESSDFALPDLTVCNATTLRKASRRISQLYDTALAPTGLKSTQFAILMRIARSEQLSITQLANYLILDRSALAHNLKPLERDGLVEVSTDKNDRRARAVSLTQLGKTKLKYAKVIWMKAQTGFEEAFGKGEGNRLRSLLNALTEPEFAATFADRLKKH